MSLQKISKNILIVDADNKRTMMLGRILKVFGYNVFGMTKLLDIKKVMSGIIPNAIMLDYDLLPENRDEFLSRLRSNKAFRSLKLITFSDKENVAELRTTVKKGASAFMTHPIQPTPLFQVLQKLLEKYPRNVPRVSIMFKAAGTTKRGKFSYYTSNISEFGIFVLTSKPLPKATRLVLDLDIPSKVPFSVKGEVVYRVTKTTNNLTPPGMGIRFVNLDKKYQIGLRNFIESFILAEAMEDIKI
jgi:uncharacterized protein (TIGR02266 family)